MLTFIRNEGEQRIRGARVSSLRVVRACPEPTAAAAAKEHRRRLSSETRNRRIIQTVTGLVLSSPRIPGASLHTPTGRPTVSIYKDTHARSREPLACFSVVRPPSVHARTHELFPLSLAEINLSAGGYPWQRRSREGFSGYACRRRTGPSQESRAGLQTASLHSFCRGLVSRRRRGIYRFSSSF